MTTLMENLEKVAHESHVKGDLMSELEKVANGAFDEEALRQHLQAQQAEANRGQMIGGTLASGLAGAGITGMQGGNPLVGGAIGAGVGLGVNALGQKFNNAIGLNQAKEDLAVNLVKGTDGGFDEAGNPLGEVNADSYSQFKDNARSSASTLATGLMGGVGAAAGGVAGSELAAARKLPGALGAVGGGLAGAVGGGLLGRGVQGVANHFDKKKDDELLSKYDGGASSQGARSVSNAPAGEDKTANTLMDTLEKTAEEFFFKKDDKKKDDKKKDDKKKEDCDKECKEDKDSEKEASELVERLEKVAAGLKIPSPKGIKDVATNFTNDLTGKTTRTARTQAKNQLKAVGAGAAGTVAVGAGIKALSSGKDKNEGQTEKQASEEEVIMNDLYKEAAQAVLGTPMEKVAKYDDPMNRIHFDR